MRRAATRPRPRRIPAGLPSMEQTPQGRLIKTLPRTTPVAAKGPTSAQTEVEAQRTGGWETREGLKSVMVGNGWWSKRLGAGRIEGRRNKKGKSGWGRQEGHKPAVR